MITWYLLIYLSRCLDRENRKVTFSSQAAICYYQSNHSKVEAIQLNVAQAMGVGSGGRGGREGPCPSLNFHTWYW